MRNLPEFFSEPSEQTRDVLSERREREASHIGIRMGSKHQHEAGRNGVPHQCVEQRGTLLTDSFTHHPSQAVPSHSIKSPARNCIADVQGSLFGVIQEVETRRKRTAQFPATIEHAVKSCIAPKRLCVIHLPFVTDRQFLAPFGSPAGEDLTASFARHAGAKSVCISPLPVVRLKRSLHFFLSLLLGVNESPIACQRSKKGQDFQPERMLFHSEITCAAPPDVLS